MNKKFFMALFLGLSAFVILIDRFGIQYSGEGQSDLNPSSLPTRLIPNESRTPSPSQTTEKRVVRVIDGDTIEVEGGVRVRYIGVDTPETQDPRKVVECFGREAYEKNRKLVENKNVHLEKDVSETDRYGRLLRYVYLDNQMINEVLVREGYAHAVSYPPDIKYESKFREAQRIARDLKLGLWGNVCRSVILEE